MLGPSATPSAAIGQSFQQSGQLGLELAGAAGGNAALASGNLTLNNVIPGQIVQAYVYANDWNNGGGALDLIFNAGPPVTVGPIASDTSGLISNLYSYRWDVTSQVVGPQAYSFTIGQNTVMGNQIAGVGLVAVYQDFSQPNNTVTILDGALQVAENSMAETETLQFAGLPAGPTSLGLFTVSDDNAGTGEVVQYNGNVVGGPIDQNLGLNASLLTMTGNSVSGLNSLSITSSNQPGPLGIDHFGILFATSQVTPGAGVATVPEPSPLLLAGILLVLGAGHGVWRKKRTA